MSFQLCASALFLLLLAPAQHVDSQSAVQFGQRHEPAPYELRENGKRPIAAIYTPVIRIAMAARAAALRGEELSAEDLADLLRDRAVYVVLCWSSSDWQFVGGDPAPARLRVGLVREGVPPIDEAIVSPLWVRHDLAVLGQSAASIPFHDAALVAAFPPESLKPGWWLFAYVRDPEGPLQVGQRTAVRGALITESDVAKWR